MFPTSSPLPIRPQHSHLIAAPSFVTYPLALMPRPTLMTRSEACSRLNTRNSISFIVSTSPRRETTHAWPVFQGFVQALTHSVYSTGTLRGIPVYRLFERSAVGDC